MAIKDIHLLTKERKDEISVSVNRLMRIRKIRRVKKIKKWLKCHTN